VTSKLDPKEIKRRINSDTKVCTQCNKKLLKSEFHARKISYDGLRPNCKQCKKKIDKKYRLDNLQKLKEYDKIRASFPSRIETRRKTTKKYDNNNKEKIKTYKRERNKVDIHFKLSIILRSRLARATKKYGVKQGSAIKDLGCTTVELKKYLESKFQPEMTWENYGKNGWHIDHITPIASFNLGSRAEFLKACHYTNLQPIWEADHKIKTRKDIQYLKEIGRYKP
jgi:hypothetical protein